MSDVHECMETILKLDYAARGKDVEDIIFSQIRTLRNRCAEGAENQENIIKNEEFGVFLTKLLFEGNYDNSSKEWQKVHDISWQLLANITVGNLNTQKHVWLKFGESIMDKCCNQPINRNTKFQLMILYNVFKNYNGLMQKETFKTVVSVWQRILLEKCTIDLEFLHFIFEYFIVHDGRVTVSCYANLEPNLRIAFLEYITNYLRSDSPNGPLNKFLIQYISKEFKIKSDCILRLSTQMDPLLPREAYALLQAIASISGCKLYATCYENDHALFINVSSVLRCLVAAGKQTTPNIFTPMTSLEEVAPTSKISHAFELDISFELKTLLVRCIANLIYNNKTNKEYCLDTELVPTLLECTNMDARNPLIKEWSILAIRNACEGNSEIQNVIANLTNKGFVKNDVLNELNIEMGSLRIAPTAGNK